MRFVGFVIIVASILSTFLLPLTLGFMQLASYGTNFSTKSVGDILTLVPTVLSLGIDFYLSPVGAGFLGLDCLFFLIGFLLAVHRPQSVEPPAK